MPTIIRKTQSLLMETKRETYNSVTWQVQPNVWRPPMDVYETEAGMVVRIDIAGIRDEDVEVAIQGNLLFINGIRNDTSERRAYHQMEIPFGKFSVGIELPVNVITDYASAEYQNGFMIIDLPKGKLDK